MPAKTSQLPKPGEIGTLLSNFHIWGDGKSNVEQTTPTNSMIIGVDPKYELSDDADDEHDTFAGEEDNDKENDANVTTRTALNTIKLPCREPLRELEIVEDDCFASAESSTDDNKGEKEESFDSDDDVQKAAQSHQQLTLAALEGLDDQATEEKAQQVANNMRNEDCERQLAEAVHRHCMVLLESCAGETENSIARCECLFSYLEHWVTASFDHTAKVGWYGADAKRISNNAIQFIADAAMSYCNEIKPICNRYIRFLDEFYDARWDELEELLDFQQKRLHEEADGNNEEESGEEYAEASPDGKRKRGGE